MTKKLYSAEEAIKRGWVKEAKIKELMPELAAIRAVMGEARARIATPSKKVALDEYRRAVIEACIKLVELEPEAGEPTSEQRKRLEAFSVVAVARSSIRATKQSIIKRLRALRDKQ